MREHTEALAKQRKHEDPRLSFSTPEFKDFSRRLTENFKKNWCPSRPDRPPVEPPATGATRGAGGPRGEPVAARRARQAHPQGRGQQVSGPDATAGRRSATRAVATATSELCNRQSRDGRLFAIRPESSQPRARAVVPSCTLNLSVFLYFISTPHPPSSRPSACTTS